MSTWSLLKSTVTWSVCAIVNAHGTTTLVAMYYVCLACWLAVLQTGASDARMPNRMYDETLKLYAVVVSSLIERLTSFQILRTSSSWPPNHRPCPFHCSLSSRLRASTQTSCPPLEEQL